MEKSNNVTHSSRRYQDQDLVLYFLCEIYLTKEIPTWSLLLVHAHNISSSCLRVVYRLHSYFLMYLALFGFAIPEMSHFRRPL